MYCQKEIIGIKPGTEVHTRFLYQKNMLTVSNTPSEDGKSQGAMPKMNLPKCPVSHASGSKFLCRVGNFDIWRNAESATDFVWPMPSSRVLKELYDRENWFEGGEHGGYSNYDSQTEPSLHLMSSLIDRFNDHQNDLFVLDIGCGYGNHLKIAAERGWKCFGVETSEHARTKIKERHGDLMTVVESAEDLLPMRFNLIVMFEVIEHLQDPYKLFFTLFGKNCIGPETLIAISTPNARSNDAVRKPAEWAYRHPPSHLVFYSAKSLKILLERLNFNHIDVKGIVNLGVSSLTKYDDEDISINDELCNQLGIYAEASGSNFKEFMHERYVPDSYWKLTEYEHFPRYRMTMESAAGLNVLDFGCGTGYGSAMLAHAAASVTGLDISESAISWAKNTHRYQNLNFIRCDDFGASLPEKSFDVVTCFEMIEHVDHEMQIATIRSIANLLKSDGCLFISTPDPRFTAPYGHNPYHLREMNEKEFKDLLEESFKHVVILKQWIRPSIYIGMSSVPTGNKSIFKNMSNYCDEEIPIGFIGICSHTPFESNQEFCLFDNAEDINFKTLQTEHKLNTLRFENFKIKEAKRWHEQHAHAWEDAALASNRKLSELEQIHSHQSTGFQWFQSQAKAWEEEANQRNARIEKLVESNKRLEDAIRDMDEEKRNISHQFEHSVRCLFDEKEKLQSNLNQLRKECDDIKSSFIVKLLRRLRVLS